MTLGSELADVFKKYGLNALILSLEGDADTITVEIPVYDMNGDFMVQDNECVTTFIEMPLNAVERVIR